MHNFIRIHRMQDNMFEEYESDNVEVDINEETSGASSSQEHVEFNVTPSQLRYMHRVRDEIATELWNAYQSN